MRTNGIRILMSAIVLCTVVGAFTVSAQENSGVVGSKVDFAFKVGDKDFPAGTYVAAMESNGMIRLSSRDAKVNSLLPVVTSLGTHAAGPCFVFDTIDGQRVLSEVWTSSKTGYLVAATREAHGHEIVE